MSEKTGDVEFYPTNGKLPTWVFESLHAATRRTPGAPVALVIDGKRKLLIIDSDDWNAVMASLDPRSRDERGDTHDEARGTR
ncbi:MAG: hypothetical protein WBA46_00325 [Thermomicrobiales bacterium]